MLELYYRGVMLEGLSVLSTSSFVFCLSMDEKKRDRLLVSSLHTEF